MNNEAEEHKELAQECLAHAETLLGKRRMNDREFLESMSRSDRLLDHEDNCGQCHNMWCMAEAAREMLAEGNIPDESPDSSNEGDTYFQGIAKWSDLATRKWQESKYFKLFQEEQAAGRSPSKAFEERGWEM